MKNDMLLFLEQYKLRGKKIDFNDTLVLGVDNGDGEYVVAEAYCNNSGKWEAKERNITTKKTSDYSLAYICTESGVEQVEIGEALSRKSAKNIYANYKKIPNIGMTKINPDINAPTYNYIMQRAVGHLIYQYIFNNKSDLFSNDGTLKKKKIMVFIGRPSSDAWEKQSIDYKNIISAGIDSMKQRLSATPGFESIKHAEFCVIPVSEARAAMIHEYKTSKKIDNVKDIYVAVFDGGSSTFDMVVMHQGKIVCEYSRQVGAGMLDNNLLHLILLGDDALKMSAKERDDYVNYIENKKDEKRNIEKILSKGCDLAKIRRAKEEYFGDDGVDIDDGVEVKISNKKTGELCELIDKAFNEMSVVVKGVYPKSEEDKFHGCEDFEYKSFKAALEDFYQGAKAKFEKMNPGKKIDDIIVTGGATIMPQVDEIMNRIFKTEENNINVVNEKDAERKYSVAKGCAYLGYIELYKQDLIHKLSEKIVEKIDKYTLRYRIRCKLLEVLYNAYKEAIKEWKDNSKYTYWSQLPEGTWCSQDAFEAGIKAYINGGFLTTVRELLNDEAKKIIGETTFNYKPEISSVIDVKGYTFIGHIDEPILKKDVEKLFGLWTSTECISGTAYLTQADKDLIYNNYCYRYKTDVEASLMKDIDNLLDGYMDKAVSLFIKNIKDSLIKFIEEFDPYLISN